MLGANIREMLVKRGKSQRDLADLLGVTQTMVSRWTRGENTPDAKQLKAIGEHLGVPVDCLLNCDLSRVSDHDLARQKAVSEIISVIGWDEAHRRLLLPPGDERSASVGGDAAADDLLPRGSHTIAKPVTLNELRQEVNHRTGRDPDGDKAGAGSNSRP